MSIINDFLHMNNKQQINHTFTIPQLKLFLKEIGEKISGNKPLLIERLFNYIQFKKNYKNITPKLINLFLFSKLTKKKLKQYNQIYDIIYTLDYYKLNSNGIEKLVKKRLYDFAKKMNDYNNIKNISKIKKIQKTYKQYYIFKINKYKQYTIDDCINKEDFLSFDNLSDLPKEYIFIYKDKCDNLIYGFDIRSLITFFNNSKEYYNPYNNKQFDNSTKKQIVDFYYYIKNKLNKLSFIPNIKIKDPYFYIREKALTVFNIINIDLNNYVDVNWFLNLDKIKLRKLYRNAEDIWNYRAQHLTPEIKKKHIPNNDAFRMSVNQFYKLTNINNMRKIILNEFYKFITQGETIEECKTGAMWMLTALVEVSSEACSAMPWLLQQ